MMGLLVLEEGRSHNKMVSIVNDTLLRGTLLALVFPRGAFLGVKTPRCCFLILVLLVYDAISLSVPFGSFLNDFCFRNHDISLYMSLCP